MKRILKAEARSPKPEGNPKSTIRTVLRPRGSSRFSRLGFRAPTLSFLWLLAIGDWLSPPPAAAQPAPAKVGDSAPFFQFRETTLGYHGPAADFTNLTEIRLGWFGPTNLDDPLTGDLWWAASYAIREANRQSAERGTRNAEHGTRNPKSEGSSISEVRKPAWSGQPAGTGSAAGKRTEDSNSGRPQFRGSGFGLPSDFGFRISDFDRLPFRLIPRWAADPWGTGVSRLTRMVYDEQPLALIGSVDSASTHLAEQVVAKANLPLVSPIATDKSVTLAGVSWMFSCAPSDDVIARVLVDEILATLNAASADESAIRNPQPAIAGSLPTSAPAANSEFRVPRSAFPHRLALLTGTDHESRMLTREVLREFSRRGRMPDLRLDVPPGAPDVSRQMERLAESKPEIVLIIAGAEDSARLVQAVHASTPQGLGVRQPLAASRAIDTNQKAPEDGRTPGPSRASSDWPLAACALFGSQSMGRARFRELAGPAAEGVRFPLLFTADPADPHYARFANRFQTERGRAPDYTAVMTYDATRLLIEAILKAGPNRARIRETLSGLSPWPGLAGPIQFDGTGQNTRSNLRLGTIRDGTIVALPCLSGASGRRTSNAAKP